MIRRRAKCAASNQGLRYLSPMSIYREHFYRPLCSVNHEYCNKCVKAAGLGGDRLFLKKAGFADDATNGKCESKAGNATHETEYHCVNTDVLLQQTIIRERKMAEKGDRHTQDGISLHKHRCVTAANHHTREKDSRDRRPPHTKRNNHYIITDMLRQQMRGNSSCRKHNIHNRQPPEQHKTETRKQHECKWLQKNTEDTQKQTRGKWEYRPVKCVTDRSKAVLPFPIDPVLCVAVSYLYYLSLSYDGLLQ